MNIKINDEFRLKSDKMNVWFEKRKLILSGKHKGEYTWVEQGGYHGNVANAIDSLVEYEIRESDAKTLKALKQAINDTQALLREIRKELEVK